MSGIVFELWVLVGLACMHTCHMHVAKEDCEVGRSKPPVGPST